MTPAWNHAMTPPEATADGEILIVDDDAILRDLLADWLEAAGYRVRKASSCRAALDALADRLPALIVSDMFMPGASGAAAIAELKQYAPGAPLIAMSGYFASGSGMSTEEALSAGAARALAKPVRRSQLLVAVTALVGPPA
jgi:CheY-like chemotaxis protein